MQTQDPEADASLLKVEEPPETTQTLLSSILACGLTIVIFALAWFSLDLHLPEKETTQAIYSTSRTPGTESTGALSGEINTSEKQFHNTTVEQSSGLSETGSDKPSRKTTIKTAPVETVDPKDCLKPFMKVEERALFEKFTQDIDSYLEWGTGGSSATFALHARQSMYAVDSHPDWCEKVRSDPCVKARHADFHLFCVDHPNTRIADWGYPEQIEKLTTDEDFVRGFGQAYVYDSVRALGVANRSLDFAFIDGRFRTACGLHAWTLLSDSGVIGVHDYSTLRKNYLFLEEYFLVVERAATAIIMKPDRSKPGPTPEDIQKYLALPQR